MIHSISSKQFIKLSAPLDINAIKSSLVTLLYDVYFLNEIRLVLCRKSTLLKVAFDSLVKL